MANRHKAQIDIVIDGSQASEAGQYELYDFNPANNHRPLQAADNSHACQTNGVLMGAIEHDNFSVAERILRESRDPTLLHVPCGPLRITATQLAASKGRQGIRFVELFLARGADPDVADKLGRTPLHHAAASGCPEMVNLLLGAGADVNSRSELHSLSRQKNKSSDSTNTVDTQLTADEVDFSFFGRKSELECVDVIVGCKLPVPDCWGRTPLHQAVKLCDPGCVEALIKGGANVDVSDESGLTPLLLAGAGLGVDDAPEDIEKYEMIVDLLVSAGAQVNARNEDTGTTALHHAAALCSVHATRRLILAGASVSSNTCRETVLHEAAKQGCPEVVRALLDGEDGQLLVNWQDQVGRTPLHCAAYSGARESLALLIKHGGDLSIATSTGVTVMDAIFTNIPRPLHFLTDELDKCIVPNSATVNDRSFRINIDFGILSPPDTDQQMAVISSLTSGRNYYQLANLLQHPLLETFLRLKWRQLRVFFILLLLINISFVISLSFYVVMLTYRSPDVSVCLPRRILIFSSSAILIYLLAQIFVLPKHYLREYETYLSLTCAAMSFVVSVYGEFEHSRGHRDCKKVAAEAQVPWVMHVTSFAVLLAWAELMLLIGRFPTWGLYALMFYTVLQNVFRVLLVFVCLVIGFSFSFSIQFYKLTEFKDPWKAFVKTTVMMMGEYEFDDMFKPPENTTDLNEGDYDHLTGTSRVIFVLFIVLTSIVLMNLMVGLAVSDIQALEQESHIRIRLKQAEFIAHLEKFTSHHMLTCGCIPTRVLKLLAKRRRIETTLSFQPSVFPTWTNKIGNTLLEAIVGVALKNQSKAGTKSHSPTSLERRREFSRVHSAASTEEHQSIVSLLLSLQREVSEMKDIIELDRNTSGKMPRHNIGGDINSSTFDLRTRKVSRNPSVLTANVASRFSEIVQGLQLRHPNLRKVKSNRPGPPMKGNNIL